MARSIAHQHEIINIGSHQWYYAPLYPLLISPVFLLNSKPFLLISIINVVTAMLLILGVYKWFSRFSKNGAAIIAALVAVNTGLWDICREPRADTLFSALLIWAAVAMSKLLEDREFGRTEDSVAETTPPVGVRSTILWTIVAMVLVMAACLTRQVGIFLVAGLGVAMLIRVYRKDVKPNRLLSGAIIAASALAVVIVLMIHDHHSAAGAATYTDQFGEENHSLVSQIVEGLRRQTAEIGRLMIPGMWGSFKPSSAVVERQHDCLFAVRNPDRRRLVDDGERDCGPARVHVSVLLCDVCVVAVRPGTRFTVPMLPVLFGSAWFLLRRWRWQSLAMVSLLIAHLAVSIGYLVHDAKIVKQQNQDWPDLEKVAGRSAPMRTRWANCPFIAD